MPLHLQGVRPTAIAIPIFHWARCIGLAEYVLALLVALAVKLLTDAFHEVDSVRDASGAPTLKTCATLGAVVPSAMLAILRLQGLSARSELKE